MKNCSVFASLISPSKMILFEKKYLEVRQKYSAARRIFNSLLGVSSGDETLRLMFDILRQNPIENRKVNLMKSKRTLSRYHDIREPSQTYHL